MSPKQFATFLGFAFVAAWIGFSFGEALLCALGAAAAYGAAAIIIGDLDLADAQARLQAARQPPPTSYTPPPPPSSATPRVR